MNNLPSSSDDESLHDHTLGDDELSPGTNSKTSSVDGEVFNSLAVEQFTSLASTSDLLSDISSHVFAFSPTLAQLIKKEVAEVTGKEPLTWHQIAKVTAAIQLSYAALKRDLFTLSEKLSSRAYGTGGQVAGCTFDPVKKMSKAELSPRLTQYTSHYAVKVTISDDLKIVKYSLITAKDDSVDIHELLKNNSQEVEETELFSVPSDLLVTPNHIIEILNSSQKDLITKLLKTDIRLTEHRGIVSFINPEADQEVFGANIDTLILGCGSGVSVKQPTDHRNSPKIHSTSRCA
ncbi:MAG: hypothetical protein WCF65_03250 [Parachlamydiaceae bacterium]